MQVHKTQRTTFFSEDFSGYTAGGSVLVKDRDEWVKIIRQDFSEVPGCIRIEMRDISMQDLSEHIVVVTAFFNIHLPVPEPVRSREEARLVLIFRLEGEAWKIVHSGNSFPYHLAQDGEIYPLNNLQERNRELEALVEERTRALNEKEAFYRLLTEDTLDVLWRADSELHITYISPSDEHGKITGYHGITREITKRKQMQDQIRQLAFYDTLTRLPNRRLLIDRLNQILVASKRTGHHGALMFVDLDNFKPLNDKYGHFVGDLLLIEAANRLKSCVREMDSVARFGGDEFVVMLGDLATDYSKSITHAKVVAEKIRVRLSDVYQLNVTGEGEAESIIEHRCSASIGVFVFLDHEAGADDILKYADKAMYQAKAAGRNIIRFYEAEDFRSIYEK